MGLPTSPPAGFPKDMGPKPSDALKGHIRKISKEVSRGNTPRVKPSEKPVERKNNDRELSHQDSRLGSTSSDRIVKSESKKSSFNKNKNTPKDSSPDESTSDLPKGWDIDPKTGKKYKKLLGAPPEAIRVGRKGGLSKEQLEAITVFDEDFDIDDLNSTAEMFLAHLRVPPDKEEQKRLLEEKKKKRRASDAAYKAAQEFLDQKDKEREEKIQSKSRKDL